MALLPIVTRTRLTVVKAALNLGKDRLRRSKRAMFDLGTKGEADTRDGCVQDVRTSEEESSMKQ